MIPVNTPLLDGNERAYLLECIDSGWISSEGPFIARFEEQFARRVQREFAVAVSNGSVALDAAVVALGIGPGDEVILPRFTIISCAAAVVRAGATPVTVSGFDVGGSQTLPLVLIVGADTSGSPEAFAAALQAAGRAVVVGLPSAGAFQGFESSDHGLDT